MSLDGFIAGPNGENDWIVQDPTFDFAALWNRFDTLIMGRRTYEVVITRFNPIDKMGKQVFVVSTTLDASQHCGATIIRDGVPEAVASIKAQPGRDVWLMGGSVLARSLVDASLVRWRPASARRPAESIASGRMQALPKWGDCSEVLHQHGWDFALIPAESPRNLRFSILDCESFRRGERLRRGISGRRAHYRCCSRDPVPQFQIF
jgi:hypothetical protein